MSSWRRCSSCKNEISFQGPYWECSVSTCNRKRTGLYFCSVGCWEAHLPTMRHREAYAVEKTAPTAAEAARMEDETPTKAIPTRSEPVIPRKRVPVAPPPEKNDAPKEILIVVSKLKKYIKAKSGMNTSDTAMAPLSDYIRRLCDAAIQNAYEDNRKTVMDRDFKQLF